MQRRADRSSAVRMLACVAADIYVGTGDRQFPCFESNRGSHEHPCLLPFYMCFLWTGTGCQFICPAWHMEALGKLVLARTWEKHSKAERPCFWSSSMPINPPSRAVEQLDKIMKRARLLESSKLAQGLPSAYVKFQQGAREMTQRAFCWKTWVQSPASM